MYEIYVKPIQPRSGWKKIFLVMKLTSFLLLLGLLQVSAKGLAQKVTLHLHNQPLSAVFEELSNQTGYDFAYTTKTLNDTKAVSIDESNRDLKSVLDELFADQPLNYSIKDKTITVTAKPVVKTTGLPAAQTATQIDVTGRIVDEQNRPLSGAVVIIKGTNNSATTNAKGIFVLTKVNSNAVLQIQYVGYEVSEQHVLSDMGTIKLKVATNPLDEVQVIAYGQTSQRLTTGNITSIKADVIDKQPVTNPLLALEGRVPGLNISQSSGFSNTSVVVRIQGTNSINNSNDPLYVVDGVPYPSYNLPDLTSGIQGSTGSLYTNPTPNAGQGSPLSFINPSDIESIEILKDASATAIYGSQAANGAILITTKKGKAGATKVNLNFQQGVGSVAHFIPMMNTQQYLSMRHEAFTNDGLMPTTTDYDLNGVWDTTNNVNWQKRLLGGTATYTQVYGDISGGNELTQFLIGGTYNRQTTVFPISFPDPRGAVHFNVNNSSPNHKFKVALSGSYSNDHDRSMYSDPTTLALYLPPVAPSPLNPDGSINWAENNGTTTFSRYGGNPFASILAPTTTTTESLVANTVLSYELFKGLVLKTSLGYTDSHKDEEYITPLASIAPEQRSYAFSSTALANTDDNSWIIEPTLTFDRAISKGKLSVLFGAEARQLNTREYGLTAVGYNSDVNLGDIASASSFYPNLSSESDYRYSAAYGRISYNWDDRYIFEMDGRRDGSSRFGPSSQFHDFYALSGAWIFSEEKNFKNMLPEISFGKLKVSYGTTGSDGIGNYTYLSNYYPLGEQIPYQGVKAFAPFTLYNPNLQWEETDKLNIGIDLGFFKDRILINANYARNRSSNELLNYNLSGITGFGGVEENFPATVQNTSWEFSLTSNNIKSKDFNWSTDFNITLPNNKLIGFPNLAESSYASILVIGQPLNIQHVFHYTGVDAATGVYKFASSTPFSPSYPTDATQLLNPALGIGGGLGNTLHYHQFDLYVFFNFRKQKAFTWQYGNPYIGPAPGNMINEPTYILGKEWQKPGNNSSVEMFSQIYGEAGMARGNLFVSDAAYTDASFVRLENAQISWTVPQDYLKKIHLQSASLFIQGQNLLTFTKYQGFDPESQGQGLPPLRVITGGFKIGL